ncbi:MAG: hypothetical protein DRI61_12600 [Chloroflexi bacterium]|nr:MAG: hypothetical protein DRI61_12600 [Chloroflexota bacterium]
MNEGRVHEPEAELLSPEDISKDAQRIQEWYARWQTGQEITIKVPVWTLLEAIEFLGPDELQLLRKRVEERLGALATKA